MERTGIRSLRKNRRNYLAGEIDISTVMRQGVVVTLSMGRWRAEQKLLAEDLCLENKDLLTDYIKLGKKTLISPVLQKKMRSIEQSTRSAVKRYSYDTPFGYFVPAGAYEVLDNLMLDFECKWNEMRDLLANEMEKHEEEIKNAYRSFAFGLYKKLRRKGSARGYAMTYVNRIIADIPTPEKVRESFYFSFQSGEVPIPRVISERVQKELLANAVMQEKINAEKKRQSAKTETVFKREAAIQKMNERRLARYETKKEQVVDKFVEAIAGQIRTIVLDTTQAALTSISKNEAVCGRTHGALKKLVQDFRMMNIMDEPELETEIQKLESLIKSEDRSDEKKVKEALTDLQNAARGIVLDIAAPKRRNRGDILGDATDINEPVERESRRGREHVI